MLRPMPVIKPCDFGDHRVKALLTRHLEGMHANSPPALRLYRKYGFTEGGSFGAYGKPLSGGV